MGTRDPSLNVGLCGETFYLDFLVFRTQEAGARQGQVHPEHTEEQQAAKGPQGGHGVWQAWRREGLQAPCPAVSPCGPDLTWVGAQQMG